MILYLESIPCGDLMPFIWRQPFWYAKSCPKISCLPVSIRGWPRRPLKKGSKSSPNKKAAQQAASLLIRAYEGKTRSGLAY